MSKQTSCILSFAIVFALALASVSGQSCTGTARSFSGGTSGTYLDAGMGTWYTMSSAYTVEFWVYPRSNTRYAGVVGDIYDSGSTESGFGFQLGGGSSIMFLHGAPFDYTFTGTTPLNVWTHVAGVFGGGQARLYINGVSVATRSRTTAAHSIAQPWRMGAHIDNNENIRMNGQLAEVRLWNVARTQTQIQNFWRTTVPFNSTGLVAYWTMTGTPVRDIFGGHDATGTPTAVTLNCAQCPGQWCVPAATSTPPPQVNLPDIVLDVNRLTSSMQLIARSFTTSSCAYREGCVGGTGVRTLLRFDTVTANVGTADLSLGSPSSSPYFVYDTCHGHWHFQYYAHYQVFNAAGQEQTVGRKQAYCLLDSERISSGGPTTAQHTCNNQGISVGWQDVYHRGLDCQWIDVTGLPAGPYTMRIELNTRVNGDGPRLITESNYDNNVHVIPFDIEPPCLPPTMFIINETPFSWIGTGSHTALPDSDDNAAMVQLPWSYNFYCNDYTTIYVSPNGFLSFDAASGSVTAHPENYPNQQPWGNGISALWDDWNPVSAGTVYYGRPSPNMMVFTWEGVRRYGAPQGNEVSFQVILRSDNPDIIINYNDVDTNNNAYDDGRSATIGVAGQGSTEFVRYSSRSNYKPILSGHSLLFDSQAGTTPLAPTADAGGPYRGYVGMPVTLDGSASSDPQGSTLEYNWRAGDQSPPLPGDKPAHVYTEPGDYQVRLTVNNGFEDSEMTSTSVSIEDHPCCRSCMLEV